MGDFIRDHIPRWLAPSRPNRPWGRGATARCPRFSVSRFVVHALVWPRGPFGPGATHWPGHPKGWTANAPRAIRARPLGGFGLWTLDFGLVPKGSRAFTGGSGRGFPDSADSAFADTFSMVLKHQ